MDTNTEYKMKKKEKNIEKETTKELSKNNVGSSFIGENKPYRIALKDISQYLRDQNLQIVDEHGDVWVVTPNRMANRETTKLNIELKLHKINKHGKRMAR